jgi:hypothetical protein
MGVQGLPRWFERLAVGGQMRQPHFFNLGFDRQVNLLLDACDGLTNLQVRAGNDDDCGATVVLIVNELRC